MKKLMAISDKLLPWDIIVVPFLYTDRLADKSRPALVISKPWVTKDCGLLWVAMITSTSNNGWASDIEIINLSKAGLSTPSVIRPVKIATIEAEQALRKIGRLTQHEIILVKAAFEKISG
jgi:mRNA interferase MazF